jgi:ATP-dependent helicase/nuclease subunit A
VNPRAAPTPTLGETAGATKAAEAVLAAAAELRALAHAGGHLPAAAVAAARQVIATFDARYPAQDLTTVPSVLAATELKRHWRVPDATPAPDDPADRGVDAAAPLGGGSTTGAPPAPFGAAEWRRPQFLDAPAAAVETSATERGTLTHLFLEHIDLASSCDDVDLRRQLDAAVARRLIAPDLASQIDLDAIAWFFATAAGERLRDARASVRREVPFLLALDPSFYLGRTIACDARDYLVVRGIIDCLHRSAEGVVLLDWKTDVVSPEGFNERVRLYRPQLEIYARAAQELFGVSVAQRQLVFLNARRIVDG